MKSHFRHSVLQATRRRDLERKLLPYTDSMRDLMTHPGSHDVPESSLSIAGDERYQRHIARSLKHLGRPDHIILVGIGGSSLGTEAVFQALRTPQCPTLHVLDEIDQDRLHEIAALMAQINDPRRIALIIVSKSGTTTETMLNALQVLDLGEQRYGPRFTERTIFISDEDTSLHEIVKERNLLSFTIPKAIGGRFSVFTAVGMVPLTLLGVDVGELRRGARDAMHSPILRYARRAAVTLALHALSGFHTVNFFTFNRRLEGIGYWYRQLIGESIGKRTVKDGTAPFGHQLLPIVTTAVDLHSMTQLFFSGYEGIYTHFVFAREEAEERREKSHWLLTPVPFLSGKRTDEVAGAIRGGVLRAYDEKQLPYRVTELTSLSAHEVGFLLNHLMSEVMCLAYALHVNAFDQPDVETYKRHTRTMLA